ncbi:flagellin [Pseudooceanicola sp. C21-150M6]|uniref:flagellin N-terminal helical domain-containing protein n=1 Tax=Pseudooceanicola sp. C21-150M6 TaxID=3434355 RepID=UPI003D7FB12F
MSSILTNNSAMVALQTLKSVNKSMTETQSQISTGKRVANAKDNSAVWAISKVMESDVKGFKAISESLSLGESTVAVAANASETVTELLQDMKGKIISANESNVDRNKLQTDIDALTDQIKSVVGAAQFNGLNLLSGSEDVNVLSSLDRAGDGAVSSSDISVTRQDMTYDAGVMGTGSTLAGNLAATLGSNSLAGVAGTEFSSAGNTMTIQLAAVTSTSSSTYNLQVAGETVTYTSVASGATADTVAAGITAALNAAGIEDIAAEVLTDTITITSTSKFDDVEVNLTTSDTTATAAVNGGAASAAGAGFTGESIAARASEVAFSATAGVSEGDGYRVTIDGANYDYIAGKNETFEDVAKGLKTVIDGAAVEGISTNVTYDETTDQYTLQLDNDGADVGLTVDGNADGVATGGLAGLDKLDVTTDEGAVAALQNIETYIDSSIDAAASFGSVQGRIETQAEFIGKLTDSLKSGIGSLVDANMEEVSARLQALQVQQQLAVQAMSIANQAPQSLLSLFR